MRSAKRPHRPEAEFFADPQDTAQRRYEALRAYFLESATAAQAAARFGYAESSVQAMVRDFRAGDRDFFARRRPGPATAPAKQAARAEVLRLRQAGHSITEITQALATTATPLNRTGIWELLRDEGFERLPTRPAGQRGTPRRDHPPRTRRTAWPAQPLRRSCDYAGVLLLVPGLVALDLPAAVSAARLPGTREVPALCSALSLLALKAIGRRRVSHVDDVATDPALATFAGLESLPEATALGTAVLATGQAAGTEFDLDFHAIVHYGHDVALETHYVPRRSQRTESVLTFFAQDGQAHNLVYANATCTKPGQAGEVMAFARHWQQATGKLPELLVFDSKVTTGAGLFALDQAGIGFLTLRARSPKLVAALDALPATAWTRTTLDRTGPYRHPHDHEDQVTVRGCPVPLRQLAVRGLGHEEPTLILTNNHTAKPAKLVDRYAQRMTIEQRLAEQIRSFHLDALSSAVALNVDLDTTLTVWAQAAYDALRRRLPGYATATPDTIWRRFVSTSGHLTLGPTEVVARIAERTYSPVLRSADLPEVQVPWWDERRLRFEIAVGKK